MGKETGFLEYRRRANGDIPPAERIRTFGEFHTPLDTPARREQAARCMNCGVPLCQSAMVLSGMVTGCPLHNLVPEWNDQIYRAHDAHAYARLARTSNFPEFTGRVCPALCEKACINGQYGDPVTIHDNELFLIERAFAEGYVRPRIPAVRSGKKVAVIGSGPSGLAAADSLNRRGHSVTVYEREDRIGGLLMYGIPNMKLDKRVIDRRRRLMEAEGVRFVTGCNIDTQEKASQLQTDYDAVILCCGAKQPRTMSAAVKDAQGTDTGLTVQDVGGVHYAVDFLTATTRALLAEGGPDTPETAEKILRRRGVISARGKHVIVVGGGDTGNDCIGTAMRHGCRSVTALEMMPAPPAERTPGNPWPEWPRTLRTDYGHEEAVAVFGQDPRVFSTTVKELIVTASGHLRKVKTVQVRFEGGRLREVPGSEQVLPCELLLIAAGFTGCQPYTAESFGVPLTARGAVETAQAGFPYADSYATNVPGVYSAGDMRRGQSLVVWAIAEGRLCAEEVDRDLMGYSTR